MGLMVLWHVPLVLACVRRRPRSGLVRVEPPTNSVIFASVLLGSNLSVNLVHGLDDHADVISFGHGLQRRTGRSRITGEQGTRAGTVDVVGGVANGSDTRQVSRATTTEDGLLDVLPESSLVEEL